MGPGWLIAGMSITWVDARSADLKDRRERATRDRTREVSERASRACIEKTAFLCGFSGVDARFRGTRASRRASTLGKGVRASRACIEDGLACVRRERTNGPHETQQQNTPGAHPVTYKSRTLTT
jgi:hypothetical protein